MDSMNSKKVFFITGVAGFIGFHLTKRLLEEKCKICIIGLDNINSYYDTALKHERLSIIKSATSDNNRFIFIEGNLADKSLIDSIFATYRPEIVINLAAQAGVRYSITNPEAYIESNLVGFFNILEGCRRSYDKNQKGVVHLIYASSSSVYGSNKKVPYSTEDKTDSPVSLYAATKKSNELMAYSYSKLYGIPSTGLRFFTVYGPYGRPDMAYFRFTDKIVHNEKIQIYNYGDMYRDFTYIDDIITGIFSVIGKGPDKNNDNVRYKIYNIGNHQPISLLYFVETLEAILIDEEIITKPSDKEFLPMQPGDVYQTYADIDELINDLGFMPNTKLEDGLRKYVKWYKNFYKL